jgi:hypothetical protein
MWRTSGADEDVVAVSTSFCITIPLGTSLQLGSPAGRLRSQERGRLPGRPRSVSVYGVAAIRSGIRCATSGVPRPVTASQPVEAL